MLSKLRFCVGSRFARMRIEMRLVLTMLVAFGSSVLPVSHARAVTVSLQDGTQETVARAALLASTGDVLSLPEGTWNWTESLVLSKQLTIAGAGIGKTVINMTGKGGIWFSDARITGIEFRADGSVPHILRATGQRWRIDNCRFQGMALNDKPLAVLAQGGPHHPYGVIDHCILYHSRILVTGPYLVAGAHAGWAAPTPLGTANTVVIEDCTMVLLAIGNCVDANYGGSYVVRHCTIIDGQLQAHGIAGNNRGTRFWEIYNNTFVRSNLTMWTPMFLRAGTGVIFSNAVAGKWSSPNVTFDVRRGYEPYGAGGYTDGASFWDGNETIPDGSGIHTGPKARYRGGSAKTWCEGSMPLRVCPGGRFGSMGLQPTSAKGRILARRATVFRDEYGWGLAVDWRSGDLYRITGGYQSVTNWTWQRPIAGQGTVDPSLPGPPHASVPCTFGRMVP